MLDDFRKTEIYRNIEKIFDEETIVLMEEEILQLFDKTQCPNCPNCTYCFKNLQHDNKRLRERLEKLEEENLSLRNKLNRDK